MDRSEITYDTCHLGVPSGASKLIFEHMVCSMHTMQLSFIKIITISKQTGPSIFTWASSPRSTIGWFHNGFWAYGVLGANRAPNLYKTNTISKWIEMRFHINKNEGVLIFPWRWITSISLERCSRSDYNRPRTLRLSDRYTNSSGWSRSCWSQPTKPLG